MKLHSGERVTPFSILCAKSGSGTTWVLWFLVLLPGIVQIAPSSLSSPVSIRAASFSLLPVSSISLKSAPNGGVITSAACQNAAIS